jgi:DNA repair exonuclease SbcCD ATPase subunit
VAAARKSLEFKFIVLGESGAAERWEPGQNRAAPLPAAGHRLAVTAAAWGDSACTLELLAPPQLPEPEPAVEAEAEAEAEAESDLISSNGRISQQPQEQQHEPPAAVQGQAAAPHHDGPVGQQRQEQDQEQEQDEQHQQEQPEQQLQQELPQQEQQEQPQQEEQQEQQLQLQHQPQQGDEAALREQVLELRQDTASIVSELEALRDATAHRLAALQDGQKLLARVAATQMLSTVPGVAGRRLRDRRRRARAARLGAIGEERAALSAGAPRGESGGGEDEPGALLAPEGGEGGEVVDNDAWRRQWRARRAVKRV